MAELTNECEWKRDVTGICEKNGSPRRTYLDKAFSWKGVLATMLLKEAADKISGTTKVRGAEQESGIRRMRRLCDKAHVKRFGFHAIRHLTASCLYRQGNSVGVIQAILRHKSPSTTERYLKTLGLEHTRKALEVLFKPQKAKSWGLSRGLSERLKNELKIKKPSKEPSTP